jgi:hypothetical protein
LRFVALAAQVMDGGRERERESERERERERERESIYCAQWLLAG